MRIGGHGETAGPDTTAAITAHAYSFALSLSSGFTRVGPLVSCKSCVFPIHLDVIARLLTDLETRRFGILLFHIG